MPTYPVKNLKTGETKEIVSTMHQFDQWRQDNPEWDNYWSQGTGCTVSAVGDVYSKTDGGWNEVLSRVGSMPGSKVKPQKTTHF